MSEEKSKSEMLAMLDTMLDETLPYGERLEAYEYLLEDCDEIVDEMIEKMYAYDGDTGRMLIEVLANYGGRKEIFMGLVSHLYKGEDVALFARLIGSYGDEQGVEVLKTFLDQYEPTYNEFMEIRNAIEELGGDVESSQDFSDDPLYRYLKGLDDDSDDRRSPFEDMWSDEDDECDGECGCEDEECGCHHEEHECGCHSCGCHHDDECECDDDDECGCHHDDHCGHHNDGCGCHGGQCGCHHEN